MQALRARIAGSLFGFAPFGRDGFSTISDRDPIPAQPKSIDSGLDRSAQACSAPFRSWDPIELPRENWRRPFRFVGARHRLLLIQGGQQPSGGSSGLPSRAEIVPSRDRPIDPKPRSDEKAPMHSRTQPGDSQESVPLNAAAEDRKSTRLNSSHGYISYAV